MAVCSIVLLDVVVHVKEDVVTVVCHSALIHANTLVRCSALTLVRVNVPVNVMVIAHHRLE